MSHKIDLSSDMPSTVHISIQSWIYIPKKIKRLLYKEFPELERAEAYIRSVSPAMWTFGISGIRETRIIEKGALSISEQEPQLQLVPYFAETYFSEKGLSFWQLKLPLLKARDYFYKILSLFCGDVQCGSDITNYSGIFLRSFTHSEEFSEYLSQLPDKEKWKLYWDHLPFLTLDTLLDLLHILQIQHLIYSVPFARTVDYLNALRKRLDESNYSHPFFNAALSCLCDISALNQYIREIDMEISIESVVLQKNPASIIAFFTLLNNHVAVIKRSMQEERLANLDFTYIKSKLFLYLEEFSISRDENLNFMSADFMSAASGRLINRIGDPRPEWMRLNHLLLLVPGMPTYIQEHLDQEKLFELYKKGIGKELLSQFLFRIVQKRCFNDTLFDYLDLLFEHIRCSGDFNDFTLFLLGQLCSAHTDIQRLIEIMPSYYNYIRKNVQEKKRNKLSNKDIIILLCNKLASVLPHCPEKLLENVYKSLESNVCFPPTLPTDALQNISSEMEALLERFEQTTSEVPKANEINRNSIEGSTEKKKTIDDELDRLMFSKGGAKSSSFSGNSIENTNINRVHKVSGFFTSNKDSSSSSAELLKVVQGL